MRHVVLGGRGQLGRDLCPRLSGEVLAPARDQADLTRPEQLAEWLIQVRPDTVINCAAYNFVDRAETEPESASAVNTWGVRALAHVCRSLNCLLVHFSTDYVFGLDAAHRQPWTESDAPGPVSVYGLSKLNGEYLVRTLCPRHLVLRTCGLYGVWGSGGKGGNFVETMLRLAGQGKALTVVDDQVCTPSYTVHVADASVRLIEAGGQGLFHLTNSGSCSWYEFARTIFELAGMPANLTAVSSASYGSLARRPAYSVLDHQGLRAMGQNPLPPWRDALAAYLKEREQRNCA
jgi:dTDP-4-dehydrorhamnose reductase